MNHPLNRPRFTPTEARRAIRARIDGVWDCPELERFGPLSTEAADVREIGACGGLSEAQVLVIVKGRP